MTRSEELRGGLIQSLRDVYMLEAFSALSDLLQGEALTLQYLALHRGETVYPTDLSRELRLSRSRITGTLSTLRRKGLIAMQHSLTDRRRIRVSITDEGAAVIGRQVARMEQYFDRMLAGLGEENARTLIRLIGQCVEVMQE